MIVYDLQCATAGHVFEAWFGSSGDFDDQRTRGLLACPLCGSAEVQKAPMAPAVPAKGKHDRAAPTPKVMLAALAAAQAQVLKSSTWVGSAFSDKARAMHLGEEDRAQIHGQATPEEAKALAEDGVPIAALPLPVVPPDQAN